MDFSGFIREIQIWLSFLGYNRRARKTWNAEAQQTFATDKLEEDLDARRVELKADSRRMYGAEIERRESEARHAQDELGHLQSGLDLFRRNFRQELDEAYEELEGIKDEQRSCKHELNAAHEALNEARAEISAWHNKSARTPWLFGNAGRTLPKHSLFGQSFGDLDDLKADRAAAVEAISAASVRRKQLNAAFQVTVESIQKIKLDRQRMFDLKNAGVNAGSLAQRMAVVGESSERSRQRAAELRTQQAAWEMQELKSRGIESIEARIKEIKAAHKEYRARFDSPDELAKRKARHRASWLSEHPISIPRTGVPRD